MKWYKRWKRRRLLGKLVALAEITSDEEWNEVLNKLIEEVAKNEINK